MNTSPGPDSIVPPLKSNPGFKEYFCPLCGEFILKGRVRRLKMSCPHCSRMIDVEEKALFRNEMEE